MPTAARSRRADRSGLAIALAVALLGIAAMAAPQALLQFGPPCLVSHFFEGWCPGCGMTRAAIALLHGDVAAAWGHNRLSLLLLPLLLWLYCRHLARLWLHWRQSDSLVSLQILTQPRALLRLKKRLALKAVREP
jgi:hypothetical protein